MIGATNHDVQETLDISQQEHEAFVSDQQPQYHQIFGSSQDVRNDLQRSRKNFIDTNRSGQKERRRGGAAGAPPQLGVASMADERPETSVFIVSDELLFKRCMNQTQLCCQGNVTQDAAFSLSVLHDGQTLPADAAAVADAAAAQAQAFTLSRVAPLQGAGRYECQLLLGGGLMTKSLLILNETEAGGGGANTTSSLPSVGVNPEPWLLYGTVLLVPVAVLLVLLTVQMSSRLKEPPEEEC
ncbi:hypothetical protein OJAV_G00164610 [Oryzias javanicus]|uniref:Immunoglobulin V-set domain-containing protein n=1 Tax=Oryzias javanicus TaxID=123683 RepID=A0A437CK70_ORYJA|nr:hypothetical protein OJAV_G00164610 [Oryzias javanicus]